MNTPTAEEFLKDYYIEGSGPGESEYYDIESALITFAKLHVTEALKAARNIADDFEGFEQLNNSILNAYSLNNIK